MDGWLYGRKSSYHGRQKGRGRSVREQLASGRAWCAEQGVRVAGEYIDDDRSASRLGGGGPRERFEQMIADIASGRIRPGDVVVAWESSRLHRDLAVYVQLRDACWHAGVLWCINGRVYDLSRREDRKASAYDAVQSEDEVYEISDRVRRTLRANAAAGRPHGVPLWGYRRVFDAGTGDLVEVVIDEDVAPVIRELFGRVGRLEHIGEIRRDLDARGVRSPRGGKWRQNTQITRLLTNPAYIGKRAHNGEIVGDAMWPPIVEDEALWWKVQAILGDPSRRSTRDAAVMHLISGIATCAVCHEPAWASKHHTGYRVYWCREHRHFACKADPVDDYLTMLLTARFARGDAARLYAVEADPDPAAKRLLADIGRWRAELEDAERLVETGELTAVRLARLEQRLLPLIDGAERRLGDARVDPLVADLIRPTPGEVYAEWAPLDMTQKRAVLRAVLEVLEIAPMGAGRRGVSPEEYVTVRWRRRGPRRA